jgi:hypothetical protein
MNEGSVEDNSQIGPETRQVIDAEVQRLVTEQYERAQARLKDLREALKTLGRQVLKQETVSVSVVKEALENSSSLGSPAVDGHIEESHDRLARHRVQARGLQAFGDAAIQLASQPAATRGEAHGFQLRRHLQRLRAQVCGVLGRRA